MLFDHNLSYAFNYAIEGGMDTVEWFLNKGQTIKKIVSSMLFSMVGHILLIIF